MKSEGRSLILALILRFSSCPRGPACSDSGCRCKRTKSVLCHLERRDAMKRLLLLTVLVVALVALLVTPALAGGRRSIF